MGWKKDYPESEWPQWVKKPMGRGVPAGAKCTYMGNVWQNAWNTPETWPPGGDPSDPNMKDSLPDAQKNGWKLVDELYDDVKPHVGPTRIIAYLPTWRAGEKFHENTEQFNHMDVAIVSFLMFDNAKRDGTFDNKSELAVQETLRAFQKPAKERDVKVVVALGGATDYGFLALMEKGGKNAKDQAFLKAVDNVVRYVKEHGLDGIDLDLECWWDPAGDPAKDNGGRPQKKGPADAGKGMVEFARLLRAKLDKNMLISCAIMATAWYGNNYDAKGLADILDWVGVMTYDYTGAWNSSPCGPHSTIEHIKDQKVYLKEQQGKWPATADGKTDPNDNPIFSVEDSVWYYSNPFWSNWQGMGQRANRTKLAVGVPIYGYDFSYEKDKDPLSGEKPPGYKIVRYFEIVRDFNGAATKNPPNIKVNGKTPRPPFRKNEDGMYPYKHNIWFETPETAVAKMKWANRLGIGNIIVWESSNDTWDNTSILKALYKASGNKPKNKPVKVPDRPKAKHS
jgi:GH18 family chitinase